MDDAEIRAQLKELGEKCGPLTATTRKIYIKKIEKLRAAKGLANSPPPVSKIATPKKKQPQVVVEDSSDEEDEEPEPSAPEEFTFKKPSVISENDINTADPADLTNDGELFSEILKNNFFRYHQSASILWDPPRTG